MRLFSSGSWRKFDILLALTTFILTAIGLTTIYSVDLSRGEELTLFPTQAIAFLIAITLMLVVASFHISFYESIAPHVYIVALLMLIAVLIFGDTIRGTTGWFRIFGFSFQPAEFAKVGLIFFLAWRIERQARRFYKLEHVIVTGIVTLVLVVPILLQPDLGSAAILCGIWFGILLLTGTKKRYIFGLIGIVLVSFLIGWFFLFQNYQKERIFTFIHPERDPLDSGYNVTQSIIAIGSGQIFGRGLGFGSQSQLHFLPESQTDFIFSVIGEELGFIGAFIVIILYFLLIWRLLKIIQKSRNDFCSYLVAGITLHFLLQITVNIGAAIGLLPVTGVTLPFLSYGGSSLIINFILIGLAESAARTN